MGVHTTGDGRANYHTTGLDLNLDGIPDHLQGAFQRENSAVWPGPRRELPAVLPRHRLSGHGVPPSGLGGLGVPPHRLSGHGVPPPPPQRPSAWEAAWEARGRVRVRVRVRIHGR